MTNLAFQHIGLILQGFIRGKANTILLAESKKSTSMGKLIKNIWIELQRVIINPEPGAKDFLPKRPRILVSKVSAIIAFSAITVSLL